MSRKSKSGMTNSSGGASAPTPPNITGGSRYNDGVRTLSGPVSQQEVLSAVQSAQFVPNNYGGYSAGVRFQDSYKVENMDGSISNSSRNVEVRTSVHQRSDGKWEISGTGTSLDTKGFASRSTAENNARKAMANEVKREGGFGRTLSMRNGRWK